jgi:hypothetical protein
VTNARTIEQECESLQAEALKGGEFVGITNDLALRLIGAIRTRDAVAAAFDGEEQSLRAEISRLEHVVALAIGRIERHEPGAALTGLRASQHSESAAAFGEHEETKPK